MPRPKCSNMYSEILYTFNRSPGETSWPMQDVWRVQNTYFYQQISSVIDASVNWVDIGSNNGLPPVRCQAITGTNTNLLSMRSLRINFSELLIKIHTFSFIKMCFEMSRVRWATARFDATLSVKINCIATAQLIVRQYESRQCLWFCGKLLNELMITQFANPIILYMTPCTNQFIYGF